MTPKLLITSLLFAFSFCSNNTINSENTNTTTVIDNTEIESNSESEMLLKLVNQIRTNGCRCGRKKMRPVPSLKINNKLSQAALAHAKDMNAKDFFDHRGSNGSKIRDRIAKTGYDWQAVGENIFWGKANIQEVFQGWKDSPSHCKNMMSKDFSEMGFGKSGIYWVQDLGKAF